MNSDGLISQSPMDSDALGQMQHFANDDDMNVFRLRKSSPSSSHWSLSADTF